MDEYIYKKYSSEFSKQKVSENVNRTVKIDNKGTTKGFESLLLSKPLTAATLVPQTTEQSIEHHGKQIAWKGKKNSVPLSTVSSNSFCPFIAIALSQPDPKSLATPIPVPVNIERKKKRREIRGLLTNPPRERGHGQSLKCFSIIRTKKDEQRSCSERETRRRSSRVADGVVLLSSPKGRSIELSFERVHTMSIHESNGLRSFSGLD
ncbi:hypothetical protein K0M31_017967 [Melipona bicolor]|uniref:Uncharacterized protein n=1 Tax=Melipona bicolor TaxID=60889 RepID=A0AA40KE54_9HYME|nr:hypothetical protein K0M31_017967 [Melipona bicolor]